MGVVVGGVDPQDLLQVAASEDQQPVQALGADGAYPALRVGIRVGCLHRRQEHLGTVRTEDVVDYLSAKERCKTAMQGVFLRDKVYYEATLLWGSDTDLPTAEAVAAGRATRLGL